MRETAPTRLRAKRRGRGWAAAAFACCVVAIGTVGGWERDALGHDVGVSRADIVERRNGLFHGRFVFAARDMEGAFDRDGHVAIEVRADGVACVPGNATRAPDGDGVIVDEDFFCEMPTTSIDVIAYFVTGLGGAHDCVASIETAEGTHQELLNAEHRAMSVALARPRRESPRRMRALVVAAAIAAVALIAIAIRSILKRRR